MTIEFMPTCTINPLTHIAKRRVNLTTGIIFEIELNQVWYHIYFGPSCDIFTGKKTLIRIYCGRSSIPYIID
ncbi:MAG: hypothetical protein CO189_08545 [candidate division Zixibacteria bacterium CG_4_9_14_3_um_filter_46_8]|nr:MAG: hypothetical protein CO189_08545 [candidate division Zixibacteria bacterium CG_4_9_14_3_um_filter_46_8]